MNNLKVKSYSSGNSDSKLENKLIFYVCTKLSQRSNEMKLRNRTFRWIQVS